MSRDNQAENLKPNTTAVADSQSLSGNIWRDMRDSRTEAPSLTTPTSLTLKETATAKPIGDFNITTGTNRTANVLPEVELFDSAPAKKEAPLESSVQVMDTASKGLTDGAQQQINGPIWETQSESLVGKYNGDNK